MAKPLGPQPGDDRATWWLALCYLAAYVALDWASYIRPLQGLNITPWNPQPALAIMMLILSWRWIWLVWAGLVAAELAVRGVPANWFAALSATMALGLTYAAVAQALLQRTDMSHPFASRRDLAWFAAIVTVGALASAFVYVVAFSGVGFGSESSGRGAVVRYWVGDAVGVVVTLPILLTLMDRTRRSVLVMTLSSRSWWATTVMSCLLLWVIFGQGEQDYFKYFYLLLLPVVWSSARFGVAGAVSSSVVTQVGLIASAQLALRHDLTVFELQALMAASTMLALLVGVLVDERARAAAELRTSLRFAAAGQMAAALAHELGQPLTALNNYAHAASTLTSGIPDAGQRAQLVEITRRIGNEAQRAGDVVNRLRDFFRNGATALQQVRPDTAVRDAVEAQVQFADSLGVVVASEVAPTLPAVWADPLQISLVLRNLIANGIEAASAAAADRHVLVRAVRDPAGLLVEVQDSGAGVDPSRVETLFDALPSRKPAGLGVGLSICRAIVEAHGGKLWAEPGPGGHFFLRLPIDADDSTAQSPS